MTPVNRMTIREFITNRTEQDAKHYAKYLPNLTPPAYEILKGRRWWKIVKVDANGLSRSAEYFFDPKTGELRESEGWNSPRSWRLPSLSPESPTSALTQEGKP